MSKRFTLMQRQVAGLSYHVNVEQLREFTVGADVTMVREPTNPHDSNAVCLHYHGEKIGYVPRSDALLVAALMDNGYDRVLHARIVEVSPKRGICIVGIQMEAAP